MRRETIAHAFRTGDRVPLDEHAMILLALVFACVAIALLIDEKLAK